MPRKRNLFKDRNLYSVNLHRTVVFHVRKHNWVCEEVVLASRIVPPPEVFLLALL